MRTLDSSYADLLGIPRNAKNSARDVSVPEDTFVELGDGRLKKLAAAGEMVSFATAERIGLVRGSGGPEFETKEGDGEDDGEDEKPAAKGRAPKKVEKK